MTYETWPEDNATEIRDGTRIDLEESTGSVITAGYMTAWTFSPTVSDSVARCDTVLGLWNPEAYGVGSLSFGVVK